MECILSEKKKYHQVGNTYLQNDITVRNHANSDFTDNGVIRLINNDSAHCFKEARLATTGGSDLEQNKYVGNVSTIMRMLTSRNDDLSS